MPIPPQRVEEPLVVPPEPFRLDTVREVADELFGGVHGQDAAALAENMLDLERQRLMSARLESRAGVVSLESKHPFARASLEIGAHTLQGRHISMARRILNGAALPFETAFVAADGTPYNERLYDVLPESAELGAKRADVKAGEYTAPLIARYLARRGSYSSVLDGTPGMARLALAVACGAPTDEMPSVENPSNLYAITYTKLLELLRAEGWNGDPESRKGLPYIIRSALGAQVADGMCDNPDSSFAVPIAGGTCKLSLHHKAPNEAMLAYETLGVESLQAFWQLRYGRSRTLPIGGPGYLLERILKKLLA